MEVVTATFDRAWWRTYAVTLVGALSKSAFTFDRKMAEPGSGRNAHD